MAQRKELLPERPTHKQYGLALAGIEAAAIARSRVVHPESGNPNPTNTQEKANTSTQSAVSSKRPVPAPRKRLNTHDQSKSTTLKPIPRVANSDQIAVSSSLSSGLDCEPSPQRTVRPPPPVAPKPYRQLKQCENVGVNSKRNTLPQNWKPVSFMATDKREDECHHGGKRIYTLWLAV